MRVLATFITAVPLWILCCDEPFEKDEGIIDGCIDESILQKQITKAYYQKEDDMIRSYSVDFVKPMKKYDVLGRKRNRKLPQRIALFNNYTIDEEKIQEGNYIVVSGIITMNSDTLCNKLSSGEWNCNKNRYLVKRLNSSSEFRNPKNCNIKLGVDYGIVEHNGQGNEYLVGGITCAWPNIETFQEYKEVNRINLANGYTKIVINYSITSKTTLGDNDHLTVKKRSTRKLKKLLHKNLNL